MNRHFQAISPSFARPEGWQNSLRYSYCHSIVRDRLKLSGLQGHLVRQRLLFSGCVDANA
jgi:hypothetical protein